MVEVCCNSILEMLQEDNDDDADEQEDVSCKHSVEQWR